MVSVRKTLSIAIEIVSIIVTIILLTSDIGSKNPFVFYSLYGFVIIALNLCIIISTQKKVITGTTIIYSCFCLFQFGFPIVATLDKNYSSYYLSILPNEIKVLGAQFTILCIQFFTLGLLVFLNQSKDNLKISISYLSDDKLIIRAAKWLAILSGLIVIPLYLITVEKTIVNGYSQQLRATVSSNGLFNIATALFMPACLLIYCYESKRKHTFLNIIYITSCILSLIIGDRTSGIGWIVAFVFYRYSERSKNMKKNSISRPLIIGIIFCLIIYLSFYIGYARVNSEISSLSPIKVLESFVAEMGFNFTTICFVMMYVPGITPYKFGKTYIEALILMIPKSIDPTGTIRNMVENLPHEWLYSLIHITYNGGLDFGVGFSPIGESFLNFGWLGVIIMFVLGSVVGRFFGKSDWTKLNNFEKYTYVVLLAGLLTFPRRTTYEFLKVYEYSIIFILLYLWMFCSLFKKLHKK